jgi:ABC-type cobalamin/Fe3+-siderophores transport system ATPase subunit
MKIKKIEVRNLWGKDIVWELQEDVNILIGINGSGKSTLLRLIEEALSSKDDTELDYKLFYAIDEMIIELSDDLIVQVTSEERKINNRELWKEINLSVVNTFDVPQKSFDLHASVLDFEIEQLKKVFITYQRNYLSKQVEDLLKNGNGKNPSEKIRQLEDIVDNKNLFLVKLNEFFSETGKSFDEENFNFNLEGISNPIEPQNLSSGEKQIFIILLKVFLQEKRAGILLMDEPELSLHINWQRLLIPTLVELNPNTQLVLATHSPTVFYVIWESKVKRMEDITKPTELSQPSSILSQASPSESFADLLREFSEITSGDQPSRQKIYHVNIALSKMVSISGLQAIEVLDFLKGKRVNPDVITFTTLISKVNSSVEAKRILDKMKKDFNRVLPNEITLNTLLKKAESVEKGIGLLSEISENYRLLPDIITFSTLLGKATSSEDVETVEEARKYYGIQTNERYLNKLKLKK